MPRPARGAAQDVNQPSMNQVAIDPDGELTLAEWAIFEQLPRPPAFADITTTNVWIVEWLSEDEQATGRDLHHWMELRRPGWSKYIRCRSKAQVFAAIDSAAVLAQSSGMVPILHLEAHGADWGIASNGETAGEVIEWHELTQPLRRNANSLCLSRHVKDLRESKLWLQGRARQRWRWSVRIDL